MKEININIEGYNVNGICVACLNYNRTMFYHKDVKECLKILANIEVPDGLTVQVCWECLARMKSALELRSQMLWAYNCLIKYSRKNTFLDSPSDLSSNATQRLSYYKCENITVGVTQDVKDEIPIDDIKEEIDDESKPALRDDLSDTKAKPEEDDELPFDDVTEFPDAPLSPSQQEQVSSDEDIQLSKLKILKQKGRKSKRQRKGKIKKEDTCVEKQAPRTRRQKNLPSELVELVTMSEEQMWAVRARDAGCRQFAALRHSCAQCVMAFQTAKQAEYHRAGKHVKKSDNIYQCDVCQSYFLSKETVSSHRSLHLSGYRCKKCDFMTSMKRLIQVHLSEQHGAARVHTCSECGGEFSTKSKLNYHKVQCSQERPQCDCCGKVFANKMTLRHHLRQGQGTQNQNTKPKLFIPCKGCDKVFFSRKSYRAHVVIHDGLTYPCPVCGKLFQWKRNLARHTRNHREREAGAAHRCTDCCKTFASRDCYMNHMRLSKRHAGEAAYAHACQYCGKKFATKWCMVDHVDWEHLKRIKYQCSVCFKAFKTAKIMVAHMNNIHEGRSKKEPDGEHLCDVCGKSYKTVKRLKGHVWAMHTNRSASKSFKCSLCPATFTWQTSIYKHMKIMHDNNKRKPPRAPTKKPEQYPEMELASRVQYFQQNIAANLAQTIATPTHLSIVHTL